MLKKLSKKMPTYGVLIVAGWIVAFLTGAPNATVEIVLPNGSKVTLKSNQNMEDVLETILNNDFAKAGFTNWRTGKGIFSFKDPRFVKALNKDLCESFPEDSKGKAEATEKCAALPVAAGLRKLMEKREVPFHQLGKVIRVGVPDRKDQPEHGHASVWKRHVECIGKEVELTHEPTGVRIKVQVSGKYKCGNEKKCNDMHLNNEDAEKLFPTAIEKHQEAVAYVLD